MLVLVTGAAGAIGKPVCEYLAQHGYTLRKLDRVPCGEGTLTADISDASAVHAACSGVDAIVHLAAMPDDAPFPSWFHRTCSACSTCWTQREHTA